MKQRQWRALVDDSSDLGTWDAVVCAFRASPNLLKVLSNSSNRPQIASVLRTLERCALAHKTGITDRRPRGRNGLLSRREAEIVDLLEQGLKTREIAAALYIAASTVKVHVHHIFEKLDARTRAEAVARYAEAINSDGRRDETLAERANLNSRRKLGRFAKLGSPHVAPARIASNASHYRRIKLTFDHLRQDGVALRDSASHLDTVDQTSSRCTRLQQRLFGKGVESRLL